MKKFKMLVGATLMWILLGHITVGQDQGSGQVDQFDAVAAGILRRAVSKTRLCAAYPKKTENGKPAKIEKEEVSFASKLGIPLMFKPGRFHLERKPDSGTEDGESETVIAFTPLPEKAQLKPETGENSSLNKVLNRLAGTVHIDPETESITRIYGDLTDNVWIHKRGAPANMTILSFQYYQIPRQNGWIPDKLNAGAKLWLGGIIPVNPKFNLVFSCPR